LVLKIRGRKRSGRICVRRACTSSVASHVGRKRTGAASTDRGAAPAAGRGLAPVGVSEPTQRHPIQGRPERGGREPGPARDVLHRGGPEAGQVPTDQQLDPLLLGGGRRADPVLGQPVQVRGATIPSRPPKPCGSSSAAACLGSRNVVRARP
jgi:hypothetical protein